MPKVLPAIYSYEDMKAKWSQDNPDGPPYTRRADLETGRYALDKWLIRVDDEGKTLAVIGWKEHPQHTVTGGLLATPRGREIGGNTAALVAARKPQMPQNNPLVTSFKHRDGDNSRWIAGGKRAGWAFPDDTELFEQYSSLLPEDVKNDWLKAYPKTFGTKPINPEALSKEMYDGIEEFMLAKNERYIRELGKSGYNVIDTETNKKLNTIGLSKSQAKDMIQLLKEGRSVWEYTKPRSSRWKSQLKKSASNWVNILKVKPSSSYSDDFRLKERNGNKGGLTNTVNNGKTAIMFSPHYLDTAGTGKRTDGKSRRMIRRESISPNMESVLASLPPENYWFYVNENPKDRSFVMVKVITDLNEVIPGLKHPIRPGPLRMKNIVSGRNKEGQDIFYEKIIVFHNLSGNSENYTDEYKYPKKLIGPDEQPKLNFYYEGIKENHKGKGNNPREEAKLRAEDPNSKYTKEEAEKILTELGINIALPTGHKKSIFMNKLKNTKSQEEIDKEMERMTEYFSM